jgi:hypothetical protein
MKSPHTIVPALLILMILQISAKTVRAESGPRGGSRGWIDLLANVDPENDSVEGHWRTEQGKLIVDASRRTNCVSGPGGLKSETLRTVDQSGSTEQSSELVIPRCDIQITEKNQGLSRTNIIRKCLELAIPSPGIRGSSGRQRMRCHDSNLVNSGLNSGHDRRNSSFSYVDDLAFRQRKPAEQADSEIVLSRLDAGIWERISDPG